MKTMMFLALVTVVFAVLRLFIVPARPLATEDIFKDLAHLWVGGLLMAAAVVTWMILKSLRKLADKCSNESILCFQRGDEEKHWLWRDRSLAITWAIEQIALPRIVKWFWILGLGLTAVEIIAFAIGKFMG
jgi:hypothetical protein